VRHQFFAFVLTTLAVSTPALAADLSAPEPVPPAAPAATATPTHWSIEIEGSPEFYAINEDPHDPISKKPKNGIANYYGKASLSYTFDNPWVVGGSFEGQVKKNRNSNGDFIDNTYQSYLEGTVGYKFKWDAFTLTPSAGIGYTWGATGIYGDTAADKDQDAAYYALYLAGDWKLDKQWTWNVFNLRWRDAFNYTWKTPKIATGVTYSINSQNSIHATVGYAWKEVSSVGQASTPPFNPNYGSLDGDKWNIAIGYKYAF
jgi:hypothetical protein